LCELDADVGQSAVRKAKVCNRAFPLFQSLRIHDKDSLPHCHVGSQDHQCAVGVYNQSERVFPEGFLSIGLSRNDERHVQK